MKIFNHDIMTCTHNQVMGNQLYSGRVLGMTGTDDIVQLHPDLKSEWDQITDHYARIGLNHSHNVIWDVSFDVITHYPEYEISVFYFGDSVYPDSSHANQFRQINEPWFQVVDFMNSKNNFMQLAQDLEVAVPKTSCFQDRTAIENYQWTSYPCYLKPAVSVDGMGITRCQTEQQLFGALQDFEPNIPFQIQAEVSASTFLNLQYRATDTGVEQLAASEQVLDGCSHSGNRYPTVHQPWDMVEPMAKWMAKQGMKEIFAFDVAVIGEAANPQYLAIECNPRFNGASYPTGIAHKLNITHWTSETFTTQHRSLHDLDLTGIEFDADKGTGVILVNWGSILVGKVMVLLAGPVEKQNQIRTALKQCLQK
ncbi:MAG: ATP-grasp domain-containing protein [Cyanothece sp. SIO1E1]|nr:ATP-grasp domain-containing protein [Cyanothece sp. SIO1E1]